MIISDTKKIELPQLILISKNVAWLSILGIIPLIFLIYIVAFFKSYKNIKIDNVHKSKFNTLAIDIKLIELGKEPFKFNLGIRLSNFIMLTTLWIISFLYIISIEMVKSLHLWEGSYFVAPVLSITFIIKYLIFDLLLLNIKIVKVKKQSIDEQVNRYNDKHNFINVLSIASYVVTLMIVIFIIVLIRVHISHIFWLTLNLLIICPVVHFLLWYITSIILHIYLIVKSKIKIKTYKKVFYVLIPIIILKQHVN
ncbi:hypothetical protein [Mycoplasmopsis caviae]|uniref:hypothetical protein n=1 Tax=Mycoplasmopsis caviae TaxID=55603 RepID=UPI000F7D91CA|nr:hypothetical protein [Mycoplasmopsis caviae]